MLDIWSFFECDHGKGEHDGAGACAKRPLVKEQLNILGVELLDARSIVDWCSLALSYEGLLIQCYTSSFGWLRKGP